jgi:hypothetical protein
MMADYPAMSIPLYLLVDPRKGTLAVFSDPDPGNALYRARHDYVFGDVAVVVDWALDTSRFVRYDDPA